MNWLRTLYAKPSEYSAPACAHVSAEELIGLRLAARTLTLGSRKPVSASTAGVHHSRFRGRGMDYQESRAYQAGDDIRTMDWRVLARRNEPHTKLFREERERPVWLLLDLNPSLFFGTRRAFKSVIAARAAALIAWAVVRNGDRVGAVLGDGQQFKPAGGRRAVMRLIRALVEATEPERGLQGERKSQALSELLSRLRRSTRPGSLVFVLSDFYQLDATTELHLSRLRQHNDVVAIQLCDVLELDLPPPERYGVSDGKRRGYIDTASSGGRSAYQRFLAAHHRGIEDLLRRCMTPLLRVATTDAIDETLRRGLTTLSVPPPSLDKPPLKEVA